jgi:cation diffusion facilitator family transporter
MKRSTRPPDGLHPYGHGKALYFNSLVAVYIFGVGGGLAVHHGISHLRNPQIPDHSGWNYAVLAFAAAFEFYSWLISYRELRSQKDPDESIWDEIIGSKDPTIFTVFLEDSAGLLGTVIAFLGIFLGRLLNPYLDLAASIVIGLLLAAVAIFLGRECGALLIGERTNRARIRRAKEIITADPSVEKVGDLLTMQLGPAKYCSPRIFNFSEGLISSNWNRRSSASKTAFVRTSPRSSASSSKPSRSSGLRRLHRKPLELSQKS